MLTYHYPYPSADDVETGQELFTYISEPIPMKEILGENYVFDETKHDFIEITILHNLVKHYQACHEICSIAEALGKE